MGSILTSISLVLLVYFILGWFISYKTNKYSWVDFFWSSAFLIVAAFLIANSSLGPAGFLLSSAGLITVLYCLWSIRLSSMLFKRIVGESEDPRYVQLKQHWGKKTGVKFFFLYFIEGLLVVVLSIPLFMHFAEPIHSFNLFHFIGAGLFILFKSGESLADLQLKEFKDEHAGEKRVCDIGLWRYSRHPNYFFEIMIWLSYGVFSLGLENWYLAFIPFLIMAVLITKVTGVPYSEEQSLRSRGKAYEDYMKKTSKLIPWFPKESQ